VDTRASGRPVFFDFRLAPVCDMDLSRVKCGKV